MKTAIIIGNGHIGKAIAEHLYHRHGYNTFNTDRRAVNLADINSVRRFFEGAAHIKIDCLVNAAGTYGAIGKAGDVTPEAWTEAIAVNLIGVYACCHYAMQHMKPRGHIINLVSGGGAPIDSISSYTASKAGLVCLTQTLAVEYPELCINMISPGPMLSRIQQPLLDAGPVRGGSAYAYVNSIRTTGQGAIPVDNTLRVIDTLLAINPTGKWYAARQFAAEPVAA